VRQRRERPWRATAVFTGWPDVADDPKVAAAAGLLRGVVLDHYVQELVRWYEVVPDEPPDGEAVRAR
jgi:hypothetical protein